MTSLLSSFLPQPFEKYLTRSERTHIVLAALEQKEAMDAEDREKLMRNFFISRERWMIIKSILWAIRDKPCLFLTDVSGLWLDCPALQPS